MRMLTFISKLCLALLLSEQASALQKAVNFYRAPNSPLISGQANRHDLEKKKISEKISHFAIIRKDGRELTVNSDVLVRDLDLSWRALDLKTGEIGTLSQFAHPWYLWTSPNGSRNWKLAQDLVPDLEDLGLGISLASAAIKHEPSWKSDNRGLASARDVWRVLGFSGEFVEVQNLKDSRKGFIEASSMILKIDLASFVQAQNESWVPFQHRQGSEVTLIGRGKTNLESIQRMITRPDKGVFSQVVPQYQLAPRSVVDVEKSTWVHWIETDLRGHGRVWWKKNEQVSQKNLMASDLDTEQILERSIYSASVHPEQGTKALVSADGVFLTTDGKAWKRLEQFERKNLPVAIGAKGELYVGHLRSTDQGKTFLPYLRWEDLTHLLEKKLKRPPSQLSLNDLKILERNRVRVSISANGSQAALIGSTRFGLVTDWKFSNEK